MNDKIKGWSLIIFGIWLMTGCVVFKQRNPKIEKESEWIDHWRDVMMFRSIDKFQ